MGTQLLLSPQHTIFHWQVAGDLAHNYTSLKKWPSLLTSLQNLCMLQIIQIRSWHLGRRILQSQFIHTNYLLLAIYHKHKERNHWL